MAAHTSMSYSLLLFFVIIILRTYIYKYMALF